MNSSSSSSPAAMASIGGRPPPAPATAAASCWRRASRTIAMNPRPLVAVDERVVAGDRDGVERPELCDIRFAIASAVDRPGLESALSSSPASRMPAAPPCSASCSSCMIVSNRSPTQMVIWRVHGARCATASSVCARVPTALRNRDRLVEALNPSGVSLTNSVSPFSKPKRASISRGRIMPTELPIDVSFSSAMIHPPAGPPRQEGV